MQAVEKPEVIKEWELARICRFTSSGISPMFVEPTKEAAKRGEVFGVGAHTYIKKKAHEFLTLEAPDTRDFKQTEWGKKYEPEAVALFQKTIGINGVHYGIENPKFFTYGDYAGGSPDWESEDGKIGGEIKCPYSGEKHIDNLLLSSVSDFQVLHGDYYDQIQMNALVRGWEKMYFVSYDPRPKNLDLQIKIICMKPDAAWVASFLKRLPLAIELLKAYMKKIETGKKLIGLDASVPLVGNIRPVQIAERAKPAPDPSLPLLDF